MSKLFNKRQDLRRNLIIGFSGSVLIHGLIAGYLSRYSSPPLLELAESQPIDFVVVEQSANNSAASSKPKSEPTPEKVRSETTTSVDRKSKPIPEEIISELEQPNPIKPEPIQEVIPEPVEPPDPIKPEPIQEEAISEPVEPPEQLKPEVEATEPAPQAIATPIQPSKPKKAIAPLPDLKQLSPLETNESDPQGDRQFIENKPSESNKPKKAIDPVNNEQSLSSKADSDSDTEATEENDSSTDEDAITANSGSSESQTPLAVVCESNCLPEYPEILDGAEGTAGIQITIDEDGNVIGAKIVSANGNSELDLEALKAAQQMEFSSIDRDRATVLINISFTVAGSDFEKEAQQKEEQRRDK